VVVCPNEMGFNKERSKPDCIELLNSDLPTMKTNTQTTLL